MAKLITSIILASTISFSQSCQKTDPKPNIVFILTDDQRWNALGFAGNDIIKTPNMDELARQGLYFQNAFASTPICAASRASLLTGLYERTHNYTFGKPNLRDEYLREGYLYLMRKAGYRTGFVGKFGVKVNEGMLDSLFDFHQRTELPYWKEVDGKRKHLVDLNGDHAIQFIKSNKDQAFCLSLSFWSPHADDPREEQYFWPEYVDSFYVDDQIPVPVTADPVFFDTLQDFLKNTMNRERWYWRFDNPEKYQKMVKGYYRMITAVDEVIGRIRNTLKEENLDKNTVIIFTSDNGYFLGDRGYAGKWLMYEQSIRTPMILFDPRQPSSNRGRALQEMVLNIDITPTMLELAGIAPPENYHGESLMAFYESSPKHWRSHLFLEHRLEGNPLLLQTYAYRDETWKFIRYDAHPEFQELYDLNKDHLETQNLATDSTYRQLIGQFNQICDSTITELLAARQKISK